MGAKVKVEWSGLDDLMNGFKRAPKELSKELQKAQEEDLRDVASILGDYPPERLGQHYRRTGTLGFGWLMAKPKIRILDGLNFEASITNRVRYVKPVQGDKGDHPSQEKEFKDRGWKTPEQALAETENRAHDRVEKAVQKVLDKLGKK